MNGKVSLRIAIALVAASVLISPATLCAVVISMPPLADAHVRSGAEKKNFGNETQLELKTTLLGGMSEGYLMFPLPQQTAFAEKIALRVFAHLSDPGIAKVIVRSVPDTNWNEAGLTWRTRPAHKETLGILTVAGLSGAWYELDLTAYVKAEAQEGRRCMALALVPGDDSRNSVLIESRESQERQPTLVLTRELLAARISFCPANATPPEGYLADNGQAFGVREHGFTYGWNADISEFVRDRGESKYKKDKPVKTQDRRYDFLAYMDSDKMKSPAFWEMALPNGSYSVRIVAGDSTRYDSIFGINVEGVTAIDGIPDALHRWLEATVRVNVVDGRLTVAGTGTSSNNKLSFLEVTENESLFTQTK